MDKRTLEAQIAVLKGKQGDFFKQKKDKRNPEELNAIREELNRLKDEVSALYRKKKNK